MWFYASPDGRRRGPLTADDLVKQLLQAERPEDILVWREGFESWRPAGSVQELQGRLPPPVPTPHRSATTARVLDSDLVTAEHAAPATPQTPESDRAATGVAAALLGIGVLVIVGVLLGGQKSPSPSPRVAVVERGGETLRIDSATGETAKRTGAGWETIPNVTPSPRPTEPVPLPADEFALVRVSVAASDLYARVIIENRSDWELHRVYLSFNGYEKVALDATGAIRRDRVIAPGERRSISLTLAPGVRGDGTVMNIYGFPR